MKEKINSMGHEVSVFAMKYGKAWYALRFSSILSSSLSLSHIVTVPNIGVKRIVARTKKNDASLSDIPNSIPNEI